MSYIILFADGCYSVPKEIYDAIEDNQLGVEEFKLIIELSDDIIKIY